MKRRRRALLQSVVADRFWDYALLNRNVEEAMKTVQELRKEVAALEAQVDRVIDEALADAWDRGYWNGVDEAKTEAPKAPKK